MGSRRDVLAAISGIGALGLSACIATLGGEQGRPEDCPAHPDSERGYCASGSGAAASLRVTDLSNGGERMMGLALAVEHRITIDPSAYAFFVPAEDHWSAAQVTSPAHREHIEIGPNETFEWLVTFDRGIRSADRPLLDLTPMRPHAWNAISIPAWVGEEMVSFTSVFKRDDV